MVSAGQALARKLGLENLTFVQGDLAQGLGVGQRFDLVVCVHVLEHIQDDVIALGHLAEAVAPDGCLVVVVPGGVDSVPTFTPEELRALDHVRAGYTVADLETKARQAGLEIVLCRAAVGLWGNLASWLDAKLCLMSSSFLTKATGWALGSILVVLESLISIRPSRDVLLIAQKQVGGAILSPGRERCES
jgi:SAM-dependent methyltransferase